MKSDGKIKIILYKELLQIDRKKTYNSIEKWAKCMNKQFTGKQLQIFDMYNEKTFKLTSVKIAN